MSCIDEWNPVPPHAKERTTRPPPAAPNLVEDIHGALMAMKLHPPMSIHFFLGEGLRWIRVGWDSDTPIQPTAVESVGRTIEGCAAAEGPLFFHALRPQDMLFFLEGGHAESTGMPPSYFGAPLRDVLNAWGIGRPVASRKTQAASRGTKARSK